MADIGGLRPPPFFGAKGEAVTDYKAIRRSYGNTRRQRNLGARGGAAPPPLSTARAGSRRPRGRSCTPIITRTIQLWILPSTLSASPCPPKENGSREPVSGVLESQVPQVRT
jgi:hypothetical protein